MRILVTGGAGFVGTNLIKQLLTDGHNVTSIDNYNTGKKENHIEGCHYIEADITEYSFPIVYDLVFHMFEYSHLVNSCLKRTFPTPYFSKPHHLLARHA